MSLAWPTARLGDVCRTGAGGTPLSSKKEYYEGGTIPWLVSGAVAQGEITSSSNFITKLGLENSSAKVFPEETVLVAMYGATAGQVGILRFKATTNQAVCGIHPNDKFLPKFMYYLLLSKKQELISQATGNAQPNISQIKIKNITVPIPPLSEQQRIIAILDEAFAGLATAIANSEKNLKNARELFDSHLYSTFERRKSGWTDRKLSDLVDVTHGFAFDGKHFIDGKSDYPILLTPGNFTEVGSLDFNEKNTKRFTGAVSPNFVLNTGDLVVVMTDLSSKMKILGKPAFVNRDAVLHNQRIGRVVFRDRSLWAEYLYYFFRTAKFIAAVKDTATGTMVKHTAPKRILSAAIAMPPTLDEQKDIASKLNDLSNEVEKLEVLYRRRAVDLAVLRQAILEKAFSGELTSPPSQAIKEAAE